MFHLPSRALLQCTEIFPWPAQEPACDLRGVVPGPCSCQTLIHMLYPLSLIFLRELTHFLGHALAFRKSQEPSAQPNSFLQSCRRFGKFRMQSAASGWNLGSNQHHDAAYLCSTIAGINSHHYTVAHFYPGDAPYIPRISPGHPDTLHWNQDRLLHQASSCTPLSLSRRQFCLCPAGLGLDLGHVRNQSIEEKSDMVLETFYNYVGWG